MKAYLIYFLSSREFEVVFVQIIKKISFSHPDFADSEIVIWGLTSLTDFYKRVQLLFKKRHVSDCQKEIFFVQITHLKFTFLTPDNIKSYYQWPTNCKMIICFEINSKDIGISKLVSQLKLLPSLFELEDNDTVVMSTIIKKKLQGISQNTSLFISEVEKIIRLLLFFTSQKCQKWWHLFYM